MIATSRAFARVLITIGALVPIGVSAQSTGDPPLYCVAVGSVKFRPPLPAVATAIAPNAFTQRITLRGKLSDCVGGSGALASISSGRFTATGRAAVQAGEFPPSCADVNIFHRFPQAWQSPLRGLAGWLRIASITSLNPSVSGGSVASFNVVGADLAGSGLPGQHVNLYVVADSTDGCGVGLGLSKFTFSAGPSDLRIGR